MKKYKDKKKYYRSLCKNVDSNSMPYSNEYAGRLLQNIANMIYKYICEFQADYYNLDMDETMSMDYSNVGDFKVICTIRLRHLGKLL